MLVLSRQTVIRNLKEQLWDENDPDTMTDYDEFTESELADEYCNSGCFIHFHPDLDEKELVVVEK